jgi:uncharacterized protein YjeT (DUF2065 family)
MRGQAVLGVFLILAGLAVLYLLRRLFFELIVLTIEFIGIIIAFALIFVGIGMLLFSSRRRWWRWSRGSAREGGAPSHRPSDFAHVTRFATSILRK